MSVDIDLNISNYTIPELEKFIGLKNKYTFDDVLKSQESMIEIIQSSNYDKNKKANIIIFLNEVKHKLTKTFTENVDDDDTYISQHKPPNLVNQTSSVYNGLVTNKETTSINNVLDEGKYLNPIETYPSNISRSQLNNLKRKTIKQTIILNSLYRDKCLYTPSTDFSMVLPYNFKNVLSLRLSSIQLPNVIYCISQKYGNNTMFVIEDVTLQEHLIEIPSGNYNPVEFVIALEDLLNQQFATNRFTVEYNSSTGKITVMNSVYNFSMNFINTIEYDEEIKCELISEACKRLGWIMGYRQAIYSGNSKYETEGIYNCFNSNYVYFVLNDFNNSQSQNILGMLSQSLLSDNILAMIPLTTNNFSVCFDNGGDFIEKKREYFGPVNIQRLKIQLLNQYGQIIDLNSMDFSFSLELEIGYDW
jgi:hypothetical protein